MNVSLEKDVNKLAEMAIDSIAKVISDHGITARTKLKSIDLLIKKSIDFSDGEIVRYNEVMTDSWNLNPDDYRPRDYIGPVPCLNGNTRLSTP